MLCAHLSLCYVQFVAAGSSLRGSLLASLAWLASRAKLATLLELQKRRLNYPVKSTAPLLVSTEQHTHTPAQACLLYADT